MNFLQKSGTGGRTHHVTVFSSRPAPAIKLRDFVPAASSKEPARRRARIFDLNANLHCSIIGTCLTMGEMRQVLAKLEVRGARTATDHEVHAQGVLLAAQNDGGGKLLNKTLDRKHRSHIARFAKAQAPSEVLAMWSDFVKDGDIPGAYWAAITHTAVTDLEIRKIFGEVHMLSHLVGAANRADIRRLRELEQENEGLADKVRRQQSNLRDAIVTRDAIIAGLQCSLSAASVPTCNVSLERPKDGDAVDVIAALNTRLAVVTRRCDRLRQKSDKAVAEREDALRDRAVRDLREQELLREIAVLEWRLAVTEQPGERHDGSFQMMGGSVLYVGGHAHQIAQLRIAAERNGVTFLHHDGGIDERSGLIGAMISRADLVVFPVDCVSHPAVAAIKKSCRQLGKPYRPLRSSGRSSFLAALHDATVRSGGGDDMRVGANVGT